MTDPLTPEQRETLREKRRMMEFQLKRISDLGPQADNWALDVLIGIRYIFAILDSLPAPKQYTEAELRAQFMRDNDDLDDRSYDGGKRAGDFANYTTSRAWHAVKTMARFLGALKEPNA